MFDLSEYGIDVRTVHRNASPAALYQDAFRFDSGATLSDTGALIAYSGDKTGRSPKDKRVVKHPESAEDIWWGSINIPLAESSFYVNRERAIDYLNTRPELYCVDAFAGLGSRLSTQSTRHLRPSVSRALHVQHVDSPQS